MSNIRLTASAESWPIRGAFTISRGSKTEAEVVLAELEQNGFRGRGECVPYGRYGETVAGVIGEIRRVAPHIEAGLSRHALLALMPPGAARCAIDCALWDLEAKRRGKPVWELAGLSAPGPLVSAYTISLDSPARMAEAAAREAARPLLKLKLAGAGDLARVEAVRRAAPKARLIVDANEAWTPRMAAEYPTVMAEWGVELIEQPLPAATDEALAEIASPIPFCADESCFDTASLDEVAPLYDFINIKLDKTGGLTEALRLANAARDMGLGIMVGCMLGTSLSMAPAALLGALARFVDLDAPLLLERDRTPGLRFEGSILHPPPRELWG